MPEASPASSLVTEAMVASGVAERGITADGLEWLREQALSAGDIRKLDLPGLREERLPVFAGGLAIMSAVFAELSLKQMTLAEGLRVEAFETMMVFHTEDAQEGPLAFAEKRQPVWKGR